MKAHRVVTVVAPCFILVLVQLIAAIAHPLVGMLAGAAIGGLAWGAQKVLDIGFKHWWESALLAFVSSAIGAGVWLLTAQPAGAIALLFAPILAAGVASLWYFITIDDSRRCSLCNRRLTASCFDCPRCSKVVCEQNCWDFQGCRCRRCEETNVPILNMDTASWDRQLGPRIRQGRCQLCMTPGAKTDLRACQRCGRPYCRSCWDVANGQCRSCLWVLPNVPARVRKYLVQDEAQPRPQQSSRTSNRSPRMR